MLAHRFPLAVQLAYNWSTSYGRAEGGEEGLISRGGGGRGGEWACNWNTIFVSRYTDHIQRGLMTGRALIWDFTVVSRVSI